MRLALFIIVVFAIFIYTADAQYFSISPSSKSMDITFNSPKGDRGWSNPYLMDFEISVTNLLNTTLTVIVSPSSYYPSYLSLISSKSSLNIPALSSESVKITAQIIDSAADGNTYPGKVRLTTGYQSEDVNVYVKTIWPPPTLDILENLDFGEVAAGKSYSKSFTLKEIFKFKKATNVEVKLNAEGSIYDASVNPSTFYEIDSQGQTISFSFKVKERDIVPGTYTPTISVSSTNNAYLVDNRLKYSIPRPIVEISKQQSEISFDYGKMETKNQMIVISEKGGKTPLENTVISSKNLSKELMGEKKEYNGANWFNFPTQVDYIAPADSKTIDIKVIPTDAPVGNYTWEGNVKTKYAGEKPFLFYFVVKPPGLEEIKNNLTNLSNDPLVIKYSQAENLRKTTESLFNKAEKVMAEADITNITSLTNVVIKFLNSLSAAYFQYEKNSYNEAYEEFKISKKEIDELNNIKLKQIHRQESGDIKNYANNVWKEFAFLLMNSLEQYANKLKNLQDPDASYAEAKKTYEKIREICSWLNDTSCMEVHDNNIIEMNNKMKELILEAGNLENEISMIHEDIYYNTWNFLGIKLIKNPSRFIYFLEKYIKMIDNYGDISRNYKLSGDQKELEKAQEKQTTLKKEYENFKLANSIYIIFLGFILILTIWKSIHGFIKYMADAKDVKLSEIARVNNPAARATS